MSNYTQTASRTGSRNTNRINGLLRLQKTLPVKQTIPKAWEQSPQQSASLKNTDKKEEETKERKWFQKGALEDGYQKGDVTKTLLGTKKDAAVDFTSGAIGTGEKFIDFLTMLVAANNDTKMRMAANDAVVFNALNGKSTEGILDEYTGMADDVKEQAAAFVAHDLYDEAKLSEKLYDYSNAGLTDRFISNLADVDVHMEEDSVFGEKTDALVQASGQLAAQHGLNMAGVPWFVTAGATSFGSEAENALRQGATYEEAGLSAAITAGTEILTEKISGGIKFGKMGTLDEMASKFLAEKISNKFLHFGAQLGLDMVGEGAEGWLSEGVSDFGRWLTYQDDKTLEEIYFSEDALDSAMESFWIESLLGGTGSVTKAVTQSTPNAPVDPPLTSEQILQSFLETADVNKLPPKTQSALRAYDAKLRHLDTIQQLLDQQTQKKADTRTLEQKLAQQQERLRLAEQDPVLQKFIEEKRIEQGHPENAADAELLDFFGAANTDDLQGILKRGTMKTQNGFCCFPDGDPLNHNAQMVAPLDGYFDVGMHGSSTMVGFGSEQANMSPRLLASLIRHSEGYNGQSIRLLSCSTGLSVDGQYCFAEELANALGVDVTAPNKTLYIGKNGELKVGVFGDGEFVKYKPNQRRRTK